MPFLCVLFLFQPHLICPFSSSQVVFTQISQLSSCSMETLRPRAAGRVSQTPASPLLRTPRSCCLHTSVLPRLGVPAEGFNNGYHLLKACCGSDYHLSLSILFSPLIFKITSEVGPVMSMSLMRALRTRESGRAMPPHPDDLTTEPMFLVDALCYLQIVKIFIN